MYRDFMQINAQWVNMKLFVTNLTIFLLFTLFNSSLHAGGGGTIPALQKALIDIKSLHKDKELTFLAEKEYQVRKYYYEIQSKTQRLEILDEVREHFEKAITKAEEKFDSGEDDVSQSAITKLKLGLAGTLNDIISLDSDIKVARISLAGMFNDGYSTDAEMSSPEIEPVIFDHEDFESWLKGFDSVNNETPKEPLSLNYELKLKTSFLKTVENREKLHLAKKNRKITRALLVSEVANYDFGIGNSGDLFEALIIYTRVLNGYYESVYNFNLAVAELNRALWTGKH